MGACVRSNGWTRKVTIYPAWFKHKGRMTQVTHIGSHRVFLIGEYHLTPNPVLKKHKERLFFPHYRFTEGAVLLVNKKKKLYKKILADNDDFISNISTNRKHRNRVRIYKKLMSLFDKEDFKTSGKLRFALSMNKLISNFDCRTEDKIGTPPKSQL